MVAASGLLSLWERTKVRERCPAAPTRHDVFGRRPHPPSGSCGADYVTNSFTASNSAGSTRSVTASSTSSVRKRSLQLSSMDRGTATRVLYEQMHSGPTKSQATVFASFGSGTAKCSVTSAAWLKLSFCRLRRRDRDGARQTALTSILSQRERKEIRLATFEQSFSFVAAV
jgi:hypothetical protein